MDRFLAEYNGRVLEDDGARNSEDIKSFSRRFRNYLKRSLPECEIEGYNLGHYEISAFLKKDGRHMYLRYSIPRHGEAVDIRADGRSQAGIRKSVLIHMANGSEERSGGTNRFCSLSDMPKEVRRLFEEGPLPKLTVRTLKGALGNYPAIADAVRLLPDDAEISLGGIAIVPDAAGGADRSFVMNGDYGTQIGKVDILCPAKASNNREEGQ